MRRKSLGTLALVFLIAGLTSSGPLAAGSQKKKNLAAIVHLRYSLDYSNSWVGEPKLEVSPKSVFLCYRANPGKGENCPTKVLWVLENTNPLGDLKDVSVTIATDGVVGKTNKRLFDLSLEFTNSGASDDNSIEADVNDEPVWLKHPKDNKDYARVGYTVTATIGTQTINVDPEIIIQKPGG